MRFVREPSPSFFGVPSGFPEKAGVRFSKQETETLRKADAIVDRARDLMRERLGSAWDDSPMYTARLEDWAYGELLIEVFNS